MDLQEPIEGNVGEHRQPGPTSTLLGQIIVLGFLIFMVMGLIKLGLVWFT